jgi:hypothetical protein
VVAEIVGVVKFVPVPKVVPPVASAYQLMTPPLAVALREMLPELHWLPPEVEVMVGVSFTVARTAARAERQPFCDASA